MTQLIAMMRSTAPRGAVGLLKAMPADRLHAALAEMNTTDITRLLPAMPPNLLDTVASSLDDTRMAEIVGQAGSDGGVALLERVAPDRLAAIAASLPDETVLALVDKLPEDRREALREAVDPYRVRAVQSAAYSQQVAEALVRANTEVLVPRGMPEGILLARTLGWQIVVSARFDDDGRVAVRDGEAVAYSLRANGVLSVTNHPPAEDVLRYCRDAQLGGRPLAAVAWSDIRHDGALKRALVHLIH